MRLFNFFTRRNLAPPAAPTSNMSEGSTGGAAPANILSTDEAAVSHSTPSAAPSAQSFAGSVKNKIYVTPSRQPEKPAFAETRPSPPMSDSPDTESDAHHSTTSTEPTRRTAALPKPTANHIRDATNAKPLDGVRTQIPFTTEVIMEPDDGTLGEHYCGTYKGRRYHQPPKPLECHSKEGIHYLTCGHWVKAASGSQLNKSQCGLNCTKPDYRQQPFGCVECATIIQTILRDDLTESEKSKYRACHEAGEVSRPALLNYITEFVAKRGKIASGVTETVLVLFTPGFGRQAETTEEPYQVQYLNPAVFQKKLDDMREKDLAATGSRGKKRRAYVAAEDLNAHRRKRVATSDNKSFQRYAPTNIGAHGTKREHNNANSNAPKIGRPLKRVRTQGVKAMDQLVGSFTRSRHFWLAQHRARRHDRTASTRQGWQPYPTRSSTIS